MNAIVEAKLNSNQKAINVFEAFCLFIEKFEIKDIHQFIQSLRVELLKIYTQGMTILQIYIPSEKEFPDQISKEVLERRLKYFSDNLKDNRFYWEVFNPLFLDNNEPVCGDLVDDIGDIYKDIKNTLLLLKINSDEAIETALWQFEFQYRTHWGDHCINALRACHYLLAQ